MTTQRVYVAVYFEDDPAEGEPLGVFTSMERAKQAGSAHFARWHPGEPVWTDSPGESQALHKRARYLVKEFEITDH